MKKLLLSLGALGVSLLPLLTTISCGNNSNKKFEQSSIIDKEVEKTGNEPEDFKERLSIFEQELEVLKSSKKYSDFEYSLNSLTTKMEFNFGNNDKFLEYEQLKNDLKITGPFLEEDKDLVFHIRNWPHLVKGKQTNSIFSVFGFEKETVKEMRRIFQAGVKDPLQFSKSLIQKQVLYKPMIIVTNDLPSTFNLDEEKAMAAGNYLNLKLTNKLMNTNFYNFTATIDSGNLIEINQDGSVFNNDQIYKGNDIGLELEEDFLKAYQTELVFVVNEKESSYYDEKIIVFDVKARYKNNDYKIWTLKIKFN